MPVTYTIDHETNCIYVIASGNVGYRDLETHYETYANDPDFRQGLNELIDLTNVDEYDFPVPKILDAVKLDATYEGKLFVARSAFITPRKVVYGILRALQILSGENRTEVGVFRTEAEAREWLGLPAKPNVSESGAD